jgi:hypothetical protein
MTDFMFLIPVNMYFIYAECLLWTLLFLFIMFFFYIRDAILHTDE